MMVTIAHPQDESDRLRALEEYQLLDTPPEKAFDRLTELATRVFDVPIVLLSLMAADRQFFKAHTGLNETGTSREIAFCAHTLLQDGIMVVEDALKDERFSSNPLVLGPPYIRFYAAQPLVAPSGAKIGTVCLIDNRPRVLFSNEDRKKLVDLASLIADLLELRRLDHASAIGQARFESIAATSPDAIVCANSEGIVTFWNRSAERMFGFSAAEMMGEKANRILPREVRPAMDAHIETLEIGQRASFSSRTFEVEALRRDGTTFPAEVSLSIWPDVSGNSVGAIVRDLTERRRNEERLRFLATYDSLTGLLNRESWRERAEGSLASGMRATILLVDLDGFKEVNDALGHTAGDSVLVSVADYLRGVTGDGDLVARLGGDEFALLLVGTDRQRVRAVASGIVGAINGPIDFEGQRSEISACVGISFAPDHGQSVGEVLGAADLALHRAKQIGKASFEFFVPEMREVAIARRAFAAQLRQAFEAGEFELYYQPQAASQDLRVVGAEALIRWNHPTRGLLTPASFINVLSRKPSASEIGEWILRTACEQAATWRKVCPDFRIGVNLFGAQLRDGRLVSIVRDTLENCGLPADALELEIVENILLDSDAEMLKVLHALRSLGVGVAFDDYGTGFASLSILKRFPVSRLKIDRSFVRDLPKDDESKALVNAILYLSGQFGLSVIAEGVETDAQLEFLRQQGCPEIQGYLVGKPMQRGLFSELLPISDTGR